MTDVHRDEPFLHRRNAAQFATWAGTSHDRTGTLDFTTDTPNSEIFSANSTCILTPDNIIGPYYVLGEQIRSNIVEDMQGVPLHLEIRTSNHVHPLVPDSMQTSLMFPHYKHTQATEHI